MSAILEEDLDPPPLPTEAEVIAALELSLAQIAAGQTVEGDVFMREFRTRIAAMKAIRDVPRGAAE